MWIPKVLSISILALAFVVVESGSINDGLRRTTRQARRGGKPWSLNQAVCPPVLCGPEAGPISGGDDSHSSSSRARQRAEPLKASNSEEIAYEPSTSSSRAFPFFEGDIVLDKEMSDRLARANRRSRDRSRSRGRPRRSIVRPISRLWEYGVIPYVIDQHLSEKTTNYIERAIAHLENHTCISFRWRNETTDPDYLYFIYQPGCWSYVGRRGGAQYVSLGRGCSYFGTALHETTHAIGFWHEQSRLDRDQYVQVVTENLAPSAVDQFGVRQTTESTSRGFAYDYLSVMHYGTHFYSRNTKPTLKVIGIGAKLGFKIGQRKGLSDLDIAQLRDMYHCNEKDEEKRACKAGWKKYGSSCYLFVTSPREQFGAAGKRCQSQGGHLLNIGSEKEDAFIKGMLIRSFSNHTTWRTGGVRRGGQWVWYRPGARHQTPVNYTAWAPNHPAKYSTLSLVRYDGTPPRFVWRGAWAGSKKQLPKFTYPYICEAKAKVECVVSRRHGRNYRGTLNYTRDGTSCQRWTSQYPHSHRYLTGDRRGVDEARHGLGDHSYCRNPDSPKRRKPWCFTNLAAKRWQYCDVRVVTDKCN